MVQTKDPLTNRRWIDRSMTGVLLATSAGYGGLACGVAYLVINADRDDVDLSRVKSQATLWCILGALAGLAVGIVCLRRALYRALAVMVSLFFLLLVMTYSFLVGQNNGGSGLPPLPIAAWQPVAFLLIAAAVAWSLRRAIEAPGHKKPARKFGASAVVSAALMLFAAWIWAFGLGGSKPQQQMNVQVRAPATQEPRWENIRSVIATTLNVPEEKVVPTARFGEDLNAGEPDFEEMWEKLESTFGVEEPAEDDEFSTVQDVVDYVKSPEAFHSAHAGQSDYTVAELYPAGLRFSKTHQWVKVEGGEASIGMTRHAQQSVFVGDVHGLPQIGATVSAGEVYATVDEGMAGAMLLAPVSGVVTAVNENVTHGSEINNDPYGTWIIKLRLTKPGELNSLFSPEEYRRFVEAGH